MNRAEVVSAQNAIFNRYLDRHAIGIVRLPEKSPDVLNAEVSSGTCVRIGERYLIATCAHLLAEVPPQDLYLAVPNKSPSRTPVYSVRFTSGRSDDDIDVGLVEIAPSVAGQLARDWIDVTQLASEPPTESDGCFTVYGYPGRLASPTRGNRNLHLQGIGVATDLLEDRPADSADIFLRYPSDEIRWPGTIVEQLPEAFGMSGGGIWAVRVLTAGVWAPETARLAGIQTAWKRGKYLRGTPIARWLELAQTHITNVAAPE